MIITITGEPGSGKSTIGKKLAEKLNYERFYIGQIRRDAAKKMGMTLAEYNKYGETHPETDTEVDDYQKNLGEKRNNFIIEGRTSWFLIPHSIKLYITVDPLVGAQRVHKELQNENSRNEDNNLSTVEDLVRSHEKRMESDKLRYEKYYHKDCYDKNNFDFVIDTSNLTPDEVFQKTWTYIESKLQ
ncbi:MAG: cytidylate kinase family protein [Candidatus Moranbacteria bacterium]|jgi:predicted cytidylate kinase|nr:cytidylate kinase family protein [Candidatus Moranbacteria bacterium]